MADGMIAASGRPLTADEALAVMEEVLAEIERRG